VLVEKGFGTIIFGTVVTDSYSRRVDWFALKWVLILKVEPISAGVQQRIWS